MHRLIILAFTIAHAYPNLYEECAKLYNPNNYLNYLPNLHMPYLGNIPLPVSPSHLGNVPLPGNPPPQLRPSPVMTTKAVSIVTKYVYKNPVCVKYSKRQNSCKQNNDVKQKADIERLVTKEYFVKDRDFGGKTAPEAENRSKMNDDNLRLQRNQNLEDYEEDSGDYNDLNYFVQGSEEPRPFSKGIRHTPHLTKNQIHELLIEDRLDQLETILPHYTRRRVYETSTVTITRVLSNKRSTATLIVKNCIPQGYEICAPKRRKRKSKLARLSNNSNESHYYYG